MQFCIYQSSFRRIEIENSNRIAISFFLQIADDITTQILIITSNTNIEKQRNTLFWPKPRVVHFLQLQDKYKMYLFQDFGAAVYENKKVGPGR